MTEKEDSKQEGLTKIYSQLPESAARLGDSSFGSGFGIALLMLGILGGWALVALATKWDGSVYPRQGCVEVQEEGGRFFKVDTCSGDIEEINVSNEGMNEAK